MEFVEHAPLIEGGVRKVALRFPNGRDAKGKPAFVEAFVDLPADDLIGKSDDEVVKMILAGAEALRAQYTPPEKVDPKTPAPEVDDPVSRALALIAKQQKEN